MSYLIEKHPGKTMLVAISLAISSILFLL